MAQFEREFAKERTLAGLAAARARGRIGGHPTVVTAGKARQIERMIREGTPKAMIADVLEISRANPLRASRREA